MNPENLRNLKNAKTCRRVDRLATDHGGHYIARIFDGPLEEFNHFAQNGNFNQGVHRRRENTLAKALVDERSVKITIDGGDENVGIIPQCGRRWTVMAHSDIAAELEAIGQAAYLDIAERSKSFFLYAICEQGVVGASLFLRPRWGKIRYVRCSIRLQTQCYDLWEKMKRNGSPWALMCFNVVKGKFDTEFVYPDSFDFETDRTELRRQLLLKYVGSAEVEYPSL